MDDAGLDMGLPPGARRLDVRAARAAFAAGTLSPVRNHPAREDLQRDVEVRDANRYDPHDVEHDAKILRTDGLGDQLGCESVLHGSYSRSVRGTCPSPLDAGSEAAEVVRLSRLRRWSAER